MNRRVILLLLAFVCFDLPIVEGQNLPADVIASPADARVKGTTASPLDNGWESAFHDDYENRVEIGDSYTTAQGHEDSWRVANGLLIGKQTKSDHGAVIRTELDFADIDIQFDFRFNGGTRFNLVIDDKNEKSVHSGHICRVSISPRRLNISDDKRGGMNLEVRKMRQAENLSAENRQKLEDILSRTQSAAKIELQKGDWHTLRIRIEGDQMKTFLDDELVTSLRSPGFSHPSKTKFGFTVNGATIDFDNLRVLKPKPSKTP